MTLGSHQKTVGDSQNWITPKWIIGALGPFDLDPAGADPRPWDCANKTLTQNGLSVPWEGRVWLNPPFDRYVVGKWIAKLAAHGNGIALLHARTEAEWFEPVWDHANAILCLANRIHFHRQDGSRAAANSGAPACLIAFGAHNVERLRTSGIEGYLLTNWEAQFPAIKSALKWEADRFQSMFKWSDAA
jgi:DNA N-6-adenine-methyltransferase (Dam)